MSLSWRRLSAATHLNKLSEAKKTPHSRFFQGRIKDTKTKNEEIKTFTEPDHRVTHSCCKYQPWQWTSFICVWRRQLKKCLGLFFFLIIKSRNAVEMNRPPSMTQENTYIVFLVQGPGILGLQSGQQGSQRLHVESREIPHLNRLFCSSEPERSVSALCSSSAFTFCVWASQFCMKTLQRWLMIRHKLKEPRCLSREGGSVFRTQTGLPHWVLTCQQRSFLKLKHTWFTTFLYLVHHLLWCLWGLS